ncbi:MAG: tRNA uridine-5-carboxymethylaminomethyl(34) synthesis GTPase MnmE, partial [Deltaproteobacteria bacterium]|nr:tRNA uridine-5-carboxymethylaminomethyl(34) synthesis GTPase MnmE [Deltaproteobacteria bacterium]
LRLMDTAGFRSVKGTVEKIGMRLTEQKLAEADLSLAVIDQSRPLNRDDRRILSRVRKDRTLLVINKIDLPSGLERDIRSGALADFHVVNISALTGEGIEGLRHAIRDRILMDQNDPGVPEVVPNLRHKEALTEASRCFKQAALNTRGGAPLEIIAMDLSSGLDALSELVGETSTDDVLEKIFSRFCIGK